MSVDLSKLSSKELFELAKQREQEEQEAGKRKERLNDTRKKREELIALHEEAIAATDKALKELELKRKKQVADFEATLMPLDNEIAELEHQVKADKAKTETSTRETTSAPVQPQAAAAAPIPPAAKPAAPKSQTAEGGTADDLYALIRGMLRNRTYISESLMKEKLKAAGYNLANFRQHIEQLMHEKRIANKGSGNYALGIRK